MSNHSTTPANGESYGRPDPILVRRLRVSDQRFDVPAADAERHLADVTRAATAFITASIVLNKLADADVSAVEPGSRSDLVSLLDATRVATNEFLADAMYAVAAGGSNVDEPEATLLRQIQADAESRDPVTMPLVGAKGLFGPGGRDEGTILAFDGSTIVARTRPDVPEGVEPEPFRLREYSVNEFTWEGEAPANEVMATIDRLSSHDLVGFEVGYKDACADADRLGVIALVEGSNCVVLTRPNQLLAVLGKNEGRIVWETPRASPKALRQILTLLPYEEAEQKAASAAVAVTSPSAVPPPLGSSRVARMLNRSVSDAA